MKHNWFCFSLLFEKSSLTFKLHTNFQISVELKINPKGQDFIVLYFYLLANIFQHFLLIFKDFYLFLEKEGAKEKERETSMCGCLSHAPYWEPGMKPRHVPWLGIELVVPWFAGPHYIYGATTVRVQHFFDRLCKTLYL